MLRSKGVGLQDIVTSYSQRGVEGLKMPYFDFSICYRAGRDEPNAKNGRLI